MGVWRRIFWVVIVGVRWVGVEGECSSQRLEVVVRRCRLGIKDGRAARRGALAGRHEQGGCGLRHEVEVKVKVKVGCRWGAERREDG
jgi:hypothetical protein